MWVCKEHTGETARLGPGEAKGKGKRGICTARKDDIHVAAQLDEQQLVTIIVIVINYMLQQMLGVCVAEAEVLSCQAGLFWVSR